MPEQNSVLSISLALEWVVLGGSISFTVSDAIRTGPGRYHHPPHTLSLPPSSIKYIECFTDEMAKCLLSE